MATIQSTKPGEITGSSVLTGRTPSYRLVLKVDPQTGQYKYEYEVDDAPKAIDTVTATPQAASAGVADPTKKTEEKKKDDAAPVTSFEQTKAALSGRQLREAQGRGPEDRGSYRDRFGTAEDQGFGFSGGTGTFRDPKFGRTGDTFTPAPGLGFAFDEFGRKRNIGVMKDIGLNVADTVGKVAGPIQDYVAGGGILGTVKNIADSITGKKEDTTVSKTSQRPTMADIAGPFEEAKQALGGTADLGSTRGLFSDMTAAREDIDKQIADLKEENKSPFAPKTFNENKIKVPTVLDGEIISDNFQNLMKQIHRKVTVQNSDACLYLFDILPFENFKKGFFSSTSSFALPFNPSSTFKECISTFLMSAFISFNVLYTALCSTPSTSIV